MHAPTDISGQRFGRLVALHLDPNAKPGRARWVCQCDCGSQKSIFGTNLRRGHVVSCGCYQRDRMIGEGNPVFIHGCTDTPTYRTWMSMRQRCLDPAHHNYPRYGGRGITIDPAWIDSFSQFVADMGPRPDGMTLDRIDVNGNYEPGNCRWATTSEQAANRRRNPITKLSHEQADEIRALHREGWTNKRIAQRFGVAPSRISELLSGKCWKAAGERG